MSIRIGQGYDVHAFTKGDHLMLGGVRIPFDHAFKAHSDGDVVLHALSDALLGAAGMGDIGRHFPDTDAQFSNIDSRILLKHVMGLLREQGWQVGNVDITIIAQAPKMAPHIPAMQDNIAEDLCVELSAVNVKATTTEHLGFEGRGEGIAVMAVALITQ
jgi:2-C-methyl-D-erythritol 2,4-cyclodiphosphate synthase